MTDYASAGRRVALEDGNSHRTSFAYDDAGRQVREIDPLGRITTFGYDAAGRRTLRLSAPLQAVGAGDD